LAAATGQALTFQKSFWQLQAWRKLGGYFIPKPTREFQDLNVYVKDHKGKSSKIQYKHTDEPNEGLGLKMCPNAEQSYEFNKRETQSKTYASRVVSGDNKILTPRGMDCPYCQRGAKHHIPFCSYPIHQTTISTDCSAFE
jgi:hypothetical protein